MRIGTGQGVRFTGVVGQTRVAAIVSSSSLVPIRASLRATLASVITISASPAYAPPLLQPNRWCDQSNLWSGCSRAIRDYCRLATGEWRRSDNGWRRIGKREGTALSPCSSCGGGATVAENTDGIKIKYKYHTLLFYFEISNEKLFILREIASQLFLTIRTYQVHVREAQTII